MPLFMESESLQSQLRRVDAASSSRAAAARGLLLRSKAALLLGLLERVEALPDEKKAEIGYRSAEVRECIEGLRSIGGADIAKGEDDDDRERS